jgi:hypothetical protein
MTAARRLSVVVALTAGGAALADITPPIWTNHSSVTTVLEVSEPFSDYAFFRVRFFRSHGPPGRGGLAIPPVNSSAEPITLDPDQPTRVTGSRSNQYSVYAIPRSALAVYPTPELAVAAVNRGEVPDAAELSLTQLEGWGAPADQPERVLRYRVERKPGGGVAFVSVDDLEAAARRRTRWAIAGVAATVAVVGLGLWRARRARARRLQPNPPPPAVQ